MTSYCRAPLNFIAHARPTVGDTKMSVISNDHMGWLNCDGRTLNVNDFYLLWRVIGYSFGGSGDTFLLPNAAGRVPGVVGRGFDTNNYSTIITLGGTPGEYVHTLSIDEMPSHTHGSSNVTGNTNGNGVTTSNGLHTHSINDPGHTHNYVNQPNTHEVAISLTTTGTADNVDVSQITTSSFTGITVNSNGEHNHQIFNTGGSNYHNNVQPMIGLGNMFMFCGINNYPSSAAIPFNGFPYLSNSQIL
jgi:microcystin-dependent protein